MKDGLSRERVDLVDVGCEMKLLRMMPEMPSLRDSGDAARIDTQYTLRGLTQGVLSSKGFPRIRNPSMRS